MRSQRISRNSVTCPECGHRNRAGVRLCEECYASLSTADERDLPTLRRSTAGRRSASRSRADEIRARVRGSQSSTSYDARATASREASQPWWQDWKVGALFAGFIGLLGLRKTDLGKEIRNIDGQDILDKLL